MGKIGDDWPRAVRLAAIAALRRIVASHEGKSTDAAIALAGEVSGHNGAGSRHRQTFALVLGLLWLLEGGLTILVPGTAPAAELSAAAAA